jgi:hypothetical protein
MPMPDDEKDDNQQPNPGGGSKGGTDPREDKEGPSEEELD